MLLGDLNFALVPQDQWGRRNFTFFASTMQNATKRVNISKPAPNASPTNLIFEGQARHGYQCAGKIARRESDWPARQILGFIFFNLATWRRLMLRSRTIAERQRSGAGGLQLFLRPAAVGEAAYHCPPIGPLLTFLIHLGDSGKVIVGLIDMNVQSLGAQPDKFILPQQSVAGTWLWPAPTSRAWHRLTWPTQFSKRLRSNHPAGGSSGCKSCRWTFTAANRPRHRLMSHWASGCRGWRR